MCNPLRNLHGKAGQFASLSVVEGEIKVKVISKPKKKKAKATKLSEAELFFLLNEDVLN